MAISNIKAVFHGNLQTVWDVVTSLENNQWHSDLSHIEVVSENQFIEYTKEGYATTFTITIRFYRDTLGLQTEWDGGDFAEFVTASGALSFWYPKLLCGRPEG